MESVKRWGVGLIVGMLPLALSAPAAGVTEDPQLVKVLSSKSLITGEKSAVVRVRTQRGVRLQAFLHHHDVTNRFGRPHNGVRSARLRLGTDAELGANRLHIRAIRGDRRDSERLELVFAKRDPGFLSVRGAPDGATSRTPVVRARWSGAPNHLQARLNGKTVHREFLTTLGTTKPARLGPEDGLRFGRNRLVVTAHDGKRRFDRQSRSFVVTREAPLAATGPDRRVTAGRPVHLDARRSKPTGRGGSLRFRWEILLKPTGSKARLENARSARPRLAPDLPGRYKLRLKVIETAGTERSSAGTSQSLEDIETLEDQETLSTVTGVEVHGTPSTPPMGLIVNTMGNLTDRLPGPAKGIRVDQTLYPADDTDWVQIVLLNRGSLLPENAPKIAPPNPSRPGQYHYNIRDNPQHVRDLVTESKSGVDSDFLVLISGGNRPAVLRKEHWQALAYAFDQLGGTMEPFRNNGKGNSDPGFESGQWSLIGIPGLSAGAASQNFGLRAGVDVPNGPGHLPGELRGRLATDRQSNFMFIDGNYIPFDTNNTAQKPNGKTAPLVRPPLAGGGNEIQVGSAKYESDTLQPGQSGFHVVILDGGSLEQRENKTFVTNHETGNTRQQVLSGVNGMNSLLRSYVSRGDPAVILIQSIGAPNPLSTAWTGTDTDRTSLSNAIDSVGGTRDLFNLLPTAKGSKWGYALVGGVHLPKEEAEEVALNPENVSDVLPAAMTGLLSRDNQFRFRPEQSSSVEFDNDAIELAYRSPIDNWPTHGTAAHRAAEDYIATRVFCTAGGTCNEYHSYYYENEWIRNPDTVTAWSKNLDAVCPSSGSYLLPIGAKFSVSDLGFACSQLQREFSWVASVYGLSQNYRNLFLEQMVSSQDAHAAKVADEITQKLKPVHPDTGEGLGMFFLGILEESLAAFGSAVGAAGIGQPEAEAFEAVSEALHAASAMVGMVHTSVEFATSVSGEPEIPEDDFQTAAKDLGPQIEQRYEKAVDGVYKFSQLLVSDYNKLSRAGPLATTSSPTGWLPTAAANSLIKDTLNVSTTQFIWESLAPLGYVVFDLEPGDPKGCGTPQPPRTTYPERKFCAIQQAQGNWTPSSYSCFYDDVVAGTGPSSSG